MIISASRRTDIPAFFGDWFKTRVEAGYVYSVNPFNPEQIRRVDLIPGNIDAIVFWTKDPGPFLKHLEKLAKFNYYFLFTLNDFPEYLEPGIGPILRRIETFKKLSDKIGKERVIWRYDPIVFSSEMDENYHFEKFSSTASKLRGYTDRVFISFMEFYSKVKGRISQIERENGIKIYNIKDEENIDRIDAFCSSLKNIAESNNIEIFTCSQKFKKSPGGIKNGACIDGELIKTLFNVDTNFKKDRYQRTECNCSESVDIGAYNTCSFSCAYCYANSSDKKILENLKYHFDDSPKLIGKEAGEKQLKLF